MSCGNSSKQAHLGDLCGAFDDAPHKTFNLQGLHVSSLKFDHLGDIIESLTCANTAAEENFERMLYLVISAFDIRSLFSSDGIPSSNLGTLLQESGMSCKRSEKKDVPSCVESMGGFLSL